MVRRIRHCSSCQRRFMSRSSAQLICPRCSQPTASAPVPTVVDTRQFSSDKVDTGTPALKRFKIDKFQTKLDIQLDDTYDKALRPPRVSLGSTSATSPTEGVWEDAVIGSTTSIAASASNQQVLEILDDSSDESVQSEGFDDYHCTQLEVETNDSDEESMGDDHKSEPAAAAQPPTTSTIQSPAKDSKSSDNICPICGSSLSRITTGLQGRLNHIKRCSKKHGVTARDFRHNDDGEAFLEDAETPAESANVENQKKPATKVNPYMNQTNQKWHGNASKDLKLADATTTEFSTGASKTKQTALTSFFKAPLRSLNNVLLANARRVAKTADVTASAKASRQNNGGGKGRRRGSWGQASTRACPQYKKIPGTDFVCDGFTYARSTMTKNYFLTHFHSDHYGGITRNWSHGIIYCSLITANLLHERLGVDREFLHPLGLNSPVVVESNGRPITVTLFDANHCPGAVLFLFQVGKRSILHVGDFRWNKEKMMRVVKTLSQQPRVDELFLDTTYCDVKYNLPSQELAIKATVDCAVREVHQSTTRRERLLLLFGAYTIGKERIYLSVAEKLGCKIYVDSQRYKVLSALEWPKERMAMLTTKKEEAFLWVVPLQHISMKNLPPYLYAQSKAKNPVRKYDRVVGFRPTGWSNRPGNTLLTSATSGRLTTHSVPYSEHSSFPELLDCVRTLQPKKIVPTVNVSKSQQQLDLLSRHLRSKQQLLT